MLKIDDRRIGLLTCRGLEQYKDGDRKIIQALTEKGCRAEHVLWDDTTVTWSNYRAIIVLSTWDYCESEAKLEKFLATLECIHSAAIPLINSLSDIKWNCRKQYLKELENKGIPILETLWVKQGNLNNLKSLLKTDWKTCVIKPSLSGGGAHTKQFAAENVASVVAECLQLPVTEWMVQPFAREITDQGEYSFIFIDRKFTHCIVKKPRSGSFMTGANHGAHNFPLQPPPWMLTQAQNIINIFAQNTLFIRLDLIARGNIMVVMELEMIEPYLYFEHCQGLEKLFTECLLKRIAPTQDQLSSGTFHHM